MQNNREPTVGFLVVDQVPYVVERQLLQVLHRFRLVGAAHVGALHRVVLLVPFGFRDLFFVTTKISYSVKVVSAHKTRCCWKIKTEIFYFSLEISLFY